MAHQAHAIPFQSLADNLKFVPANTRYLGITNLYPRSKPGQAKQLQHFARAFARTLGEYAAIERKKYAAEYTVPEDDEIIISDATADNIHNVVREYMKQAVERDPDRHKELLPRRRRTIWHWIDVSTWNSCHPSDCLLHTDELLRTLIMRGEMETVFRIAAHPQVRFDQIWTQNGRFAFELGGYGLSELKETALLAYICLNVLHLKPELYDPTIRAQTLRDRAARHEALAAPDMYDYRLTAAYQQMLVYCTGLGYPYADYGAHKLPHREFFGVPYGMYTAPVQWHDHVPRTPSARRYGQTPLADLTAKTFPHKHIPSQSSIPTVIALLRSLKLPTELALHTSWMGHKRRVLDP
jgi:hypothetical protein